MDSFFFLLGLIGFGFIIAGPVAFFMVLGLRNRLDHALATIVLLQNRVRLLEERGPLSPDERKPAAPPPAPDKVDVEIRTVPPLDEPRAEEPSPAAPEPPAPVSTPAPKPGRRSLEEALGTRWTVWVGGLALALGALLLVRYSIEQGVFGPGARIVMGLLLAFALVATGEVLRRRHKDAPRAPVDIPAMLSACGAVAAFGAVYAAYGVYQFIGGTLALLVLAAVALACMVASALHGPALAGLGLVGAFATPLLVASDAPNGWALTVYLAVVAAAAHGLARLRQWRWLAVSSAVCAMAWMFAYLATFHVPGSAVPFFQAGTLHLLIQTAMAGVVLSYLPFRATQSEVRAFDRTACIVPLAFALIGAIWLAITGTYGQFGALWIVDVVAMAAMPAALALLSREVTPLFILSGIFSLLMIDAWPGATPGSAGHRVYWMPPVFGTDLAPASPVLYAAVAALLTLGLAVAGARRLLTDAGMTSREGMIFAGVAAIAPLGAVTLAWWRNGVASHDFLFAAIAAALAALFVFGATVFRQALSAASEMDRERLTFGLGVAASASFAALALALVFALEGGTLTVALALAALACAHVSVRLDIRALRWCVAGFALAIAARLVWDPRVVGNDLGKTIVFNWLLFGYGVPALAMGLAGRVMRRHGGEDSPVRIAQAASILLAGFLVMFEIRHALYDGDILAARSDLVEQGLNTVAALGFAAVLTRLDAASSSVVFRIASYAFGVLSLASAAIGLGVIENPYLFGERVRGGAWFNTLLLGYALPALCAFAVAKLSDGRRHIVYVMAMRVATILLTFGYLTLETRQVFHADGALRFWHTTSDAEFYSYSAVWLLFALVLLAYGVWRGSREVRLASAVFLVTTVLKVFLFDLAGLEGLLRALSFIGLGVVLIGVGLVYQKFVFRPRRPDMV